MARSVNGKEIAREMNDKLRAEIKQLVTGDANSPKLVSISAGKKSADADLYVEMQRKASGYVGIEFCTMRLPETATESDIIEKIKSLNEDKTVTAIIVQKPLPEGIMHDAVVGRIFPEKDAEGIHPLNLGRILRNDADIVPSTPGAVMKILRISEVDLYGKEVVIIGHSAIVGKPLSLMMLNETATTTVCHIGTAKKGSLVKHALQADVLVVAVGKAELVKGDWIKEGAVVIDVGINKMGGKIVGDVNFSECAEKASIITPVPGGVGPVTVSILMRNVLRAYRKQNVKN
ncbi:MAG: bifunctional 5,10-methylenetetrahydrofolate dehydrogenase/5,10-methenyltetrahydrofolate cyclohydrolase [Candidatus Omnitrophica bacterium]|nr:bifunctional 5,10-methylenetetrahydrofolate dehydrogenase/5,10-methenyltetrahydrofolate cyclohydrolase [Candidatus Omnitrophota bacterium]